MFKKCTILYTYALIVYFTFSAVAENKKINHRFLCCDYQGNKVALIANDGTVEWEYSAGNPQDCWLLPSGNILICHRNGIKEVNLKKEVVWEYKAPPKAMCHSTQPLPDGNVLVAECGMNRLVEIDNKGQIKKIIPISSKPKIISHQFRGTRKTAKGHYLVCLMDEQKIVELDPNGNLIREIPVDGFPHAAVLLPNENLLVTLGQSGRVIELDKNLNIVWKIDMNELPGNVLRLPAGCQRLPNGNTIICNYLPGEHVGKQPQAFEVTPDKKIVWEFTDHERFKTVNQIYLLDLPESKNWKKALR
jgi:outer membrane protein assembly factor BamB